MATHIQPLKEVTQFLVIEHTHPGHHIYEIGHEVKVLKHFDNEEAGRQYLHNQLTELSANKRAADLILAGAYRGRVFKLDVEGHPRDYCGITLMYVHCDKYGQKRVLATDQIDSPQTVTQVFYARYNKRNGGFDLHDGSLQKAKPQLLPDACYPNYFIKEVFTIKQLKLMNQESYQYNADTLKNLGFGDEIAKELHTKMDQNLAEFTLNHTRQFGKDVLESVLHFSKGDDTAKDLTFFNRFDSTLKKEGMEDLTQSFFVGQKFNYTLQERYNMMDGRSVFREQPKMEPTEDNGVTKMKPTGETYFAWRGLNFKEADKYGNFNPKIIFWDHEKELQKYPIKNIEEKYDRARIMRPLEKGNRVAVMLLSDGQETQAQVVANPRMMRLDFYDAAGQSLTVRKTEKQAVGQNQKAEMTPQQVQKAAISRAADQAQANTPAQNQAVGAKQNETEQNQQQGQRRRQGLQV